MLFHELRQPTIQLSACHAGQKKIIRSLDAICCIQQRGVIMLGWLVMLNSSPKFSDVEIAF